MNYNFDLRPYEAKCFISDEDWQMIFESGAYIQTGKVYHAVFKRHVLTFKITEVENGLVNCELLSKRKVPCGKYKLPMLDNTMSFKQRSAVYLERERLQKGRELDDEHFLIYGT